MKPYHEQLLEEVDREEAERGEGDLLFVELLVFYTWLVALWYATEGAL